MNCDHVKKKLAACAAGLLRGRQARRAAAHIEQCPTCRREVERLRQAGELASALELEEPRRDLWPAVYAQIVSRRVPQLAWQTAARAVAGLAVTLALIMAGTWAARPPAPAPPAPVVEVDEAASAYLGQHALAAWRAPLADPAALGVTLAAAPAPERGRDQ